MSLLFKKFSSSRRSIITAGTHSSSSFGFSSQQVDTIIPLNMVILAKNIPIDSTEQANLDNTIKARELFAKAKELTGKVNGQIQEKNHPRARQLLTDNTDEAGNLTQIKAEIAALSKSSAESADLVVKVQNMYNNCESKLKIATGELKVTEEKPFEPASEEPNTEVAKPVVAHLRVKLMDKNEYDINFTNMEELNEVLNRL